MAAFAAALHSAPDYTPAAYNLPRLELAAGDTPAAGAELLDASTFDRMLTVTRGLFALPGVRICWQMILPRVSATDRALIETLLLKDQAAVTASDLAATWQSVAAQMFPPPA